jgi:hypothetical protein
VPLAARREVRLKQISTERVEVVAGLKPGERVVSKASFFVRAERESLDWVLRRARRVRRAGRSEPID